MKEIKPLKHLFVRFVVHKVKIRKEWKKSFIWNIIALGLLNRKLRTFHSFSQLMIQQFLKSLSVFFVYKRNKNFETSFCSFVVHKLKNKQKPKKSFVWNIFVLGLLNTKLTNKTFFTFHNLWFYLFTKKIQPGLLPCFVYVRNKNCETLLC